MGFPCAQTNYFLSIPTRCPLLYMGGNHLSYPILSIHRSLWRAFPAKIADNSWLLMRFGPILRMDQVCKRNFRTPLFSRSGTRAGPHCVHGWKLRERELDKRTSKKASKAIPKAKFKNYLHCSLWPWILIVTMRQLSDLSRLRRIPTGIPLARRRLLRGITTRYSINRCAHKPQLTARLRTE